MPILGIGNSMKLRFPGGYTLIEILAVLTLIGILMAVVYPQLTNSPERNKIVYIGKLLKADLDLVREEAFSGKEELVVEFNTRGYHFRIGESQIVRVFMDYQFAFEITEPEESEDAEKTGESSSSPEPSASPTPILISLGSPNDGSGTGDSQPAAEEEDMEDDFEAAEVEEPGPNELKFTSDGKCNSFEVAWRSQHYSGKLSVDQDGAVTWEYGKN